MPDLYISQILLQFYRNVIVWDSAAKVRSVQSGSCIKFVNTELDSGSHSGIWLNLGLNVPEHVQHIQFAFKPGLNAEPVPK